MTEQSEQTPRGPMPETMRRAVFSVWNNRCAYCRTGVAAHVDHVVPLARGGADEPSNYVAACDVCNLRKSDNLLAEGFCQIVLAQAKNRVEKVRRMVDAVPAKPRGRSALIDVPPAFVTGLSPHAVQLLAGAKWSRQGAGRAARLVCSIDDPAVLQELVNGLPGFSGFKFRYGGSVAFDCVEVQCEGDTPVGAWLYTRNPCVIRALRLCVEAGADAVQVPLSWCRAPAPAGPVSPRP